MRRLLWLLLCLPAFAQSTVNNSGTSVNNGTAANVPKTGTGSPVGVVPCTASDAGQGYAQMLGSEAVQWMCSLLPTGNYQWQTLGTSTPELRYVGATPVDPFVPQISQACSSPVDCVVNTTGTGGMSGISMDGGQPGDAVHILQHGPALCKFLNTPVQNDSALVGVGGCVDSPLGFAAVDSKQGFIGKVLQYVDSTHAYVNIVYPGAVGESVKTSSLVNDLGWGPSGTAAKPVFLSPSASTIDLTNCALTAPCFATLNLTANAAPSVTGIQAGVTLYLAVCNGATSYTFTAPAALHGSMIVPIGPNTCNVQPFTSFNGTTLDALSGGVNEPL